MKRAKDNVEYFGLEMPIRVFFVSAFDHRVSSLVIDVPAYSRKPTRARQGLDAAIFDWFLLCELRLVFSV